MISYKFRPGLEGAWASWAYIESVPASLGSRVMHLRQDQPDTFDVTVIPHLFLFGPDGEIVEDGMRGEDTDALLKTIFQ